MVLYIFMDVEDCKKMIEIRKEEVKQSVRGDKFPATVKLLGMVRFVLFSFRYVILDDEAEIVHTVFDEFGCHFS